MWCLLRIVGWLFIILSVLYVAEAVAAEVAGARGEPVYLVSGVGLLVVGFALKAVAGSRIRKKPPAGKLE